MCSWARRRGARPSRRSCTRTPARTSSKASRDCTALAGGARRRGRRGALKSEGLEPPFVGRDRELRLIKDLFHASAEERRAHLISVTGIAGIGKSRLVWEFYKYVDGLAEIVYWHRGRCLSYGEGVAYWALADMVRMRCRISEDESTASALAKLAVGWTSTSPTPTSAGSSSRGWRTCSASRRAARSAARICSPPGGCSSSGWPTCTRRCWSSRTCSGRTQRCSTSSSTCSTGRARPALVVTAARPELVERRPTWGAGKRNFTRSTSSRSHRRRWKSCWRGSCRGCPTCARPDSRARRGRAALRGRDGAHAARPRPARPRGRVYRPTGPSRRSRSPRRCTP